MSSGCPELPVLVQTLLAKAGRVLACAWLSCAIGPLPAALANSSELRVCADPNNLPFSNKDEEGFENKIVDVVARDLGKTVTYVWWAQRRGFIRNTLDAKLCDLVPGIPVNLERLRATKPYYRSAYVFVTRQDGPEISSFDDPRLRQLRVGVQLIGDDGANSPPVEALAKRGIVGQLVGFRVYGDYSHPNPPARIVEAVTAREIDVAVVWGPLAGYFAGRQPIKLQITPVSPLVDGPQLPMIYDISMGVRRGDEAMLSEINAALKKHRADMDAILAAYHVPRVNELAAQLP